MADRIAAAIIQTVDGEVVPPDYVDEGPDSPAVVREWLEAQGWEVYFPTFVLNNRLELTFAFEGDDDGNGNSNVLEITFYLGDDTASVAPIVEEVLKQFA